MFPQEYSSKSFSSLQAFSQQAQRLQAMNPNPDKPSLLEMSEELSRTTANSPRNNPARWEYDRLVDFIKEFEATLNDDQEIGLQVFPHSGATGYYVREIECWSPYIIAFHCFTQDGRRATLIQHHSQLNFLLTVLPKHDPQLPAKRIGFRVYSDDSSAEAG